MAMTTLIVMRHAKSDWSTMAPDHERPLNTRGHRDAVAAGAYLARYQIDHVVCSTAERTRQTWKRAQAGGTSATTVDFNADVYEATLGDLLGVVRQIPPPTQTALLLGHYPGVADLVERLAVADDNPAWTAMAIKYPTAAIAVLDFELPWPELHGGAARLIDYQVPRG